eukprot:NODE_238_length_11959_cov_0.380270.p7 type:complete len:209 gc:universal NODE_238_length_11959_cov_0.380270:9389-10015(+)
MIFMILLSIIFGNEKDDFRFASKVGHDIQKILKKLNVQEKHLKFLFFNRLVEIAKNLDYMGYREILMGRNDNSQWLINEFESLKQIEVYDNNLKRYVSNYNDEKDPEKKIEMRKNLAETWVKYSAAYRRMVPTPDSLDAIESEAEQSKREFDHTFESNTRRVRTTFDKYLFEPGYHQPFETGLMNTELARTSSEGRNIDSMEVVPHVA